MEVIQIVSKILTFVLCEIKNNGGITRGMKGRLSQPLTHRKLVTILKYHAALSESQALVLADTIFDAPFGVVFIKAGGKK